MKIPNEKEFAIKKAILKAIEQGYSVAQLADGFGVSRSLIYKYRRALRDQGFIKKNENDVYVITENKFSMKPEAPKTASLDLKYTDLNDPNIYSEEIQLTETEEETSPNEDCLQSNDSENIESIQNSVDQMHKLNELKRANKSRTKKGFLNKVFGKIKKII
ncbi:helix-turn-helix domain-containing protein [Francisella sp. SYW-2]|jgi:transposase-like protein|uniref:FTL_1293 family small RNA FtrC-regulated protein n=1 Tax=Francisella sp. SYW-2 TaxID=2610886 RepID=UPI00123C7E48|nr:helix-turn-helix domain-containing protein [Francisella sp. SYW-2]